MPGEARSRQEDQQVKRPWGMSVLGCWENPTEASIGWRVVSKGEECGLQVKVEREGQTPKGLKSHGKELDFHPKNHENPPGDFKKGWWVHDLRF